MNLPPSSEPLDNDGGGQQRPPPSPPDTERRGNSSDGEPSLDTADTGTPSSSLQGQPPPEPPVRPSRLPPRRRATHGSSGGGVQSSIRSACNVRQNSIRFRHDELDWHEESSYSDNSHVIPMNGMEVMDLRPRRMTHTESVSVSSSLVSFSSTISVDSELKLANSGGKYARRYIIENGSNEHGGLFRVASDTSGNSSGSASGGDPPLRGDLPKHWSAATVASTKERGDRSHHSFRALMSLMRGGDDNASGAVSRRGSLGSVSTGRSNVGTGRSKASGFASAFTAGFVSIFTAGFVGTFTRPPDSISVSVGESETCSMLTESSPLMDSKRQQQVNKLYMRRCARAIAGFVALAALSGAVIIYCFAEEDRESILEFLPVNNFLGKLLGNGNNNSGEQQEQKDHQLRYRKLPQGGNDVEIVLTPPEHQGTDYYDKDNLQDEDYYNDGRQDYTTVHQDHLVDQRWNDPHQE